jgi:tRNA(fMet)-specific endonuclease VapC
MLDTNILSYLAKGVSKTLDERFRQFSPDEVCISVVTEAEQLYGFERLDRNHRIRRVISDLMESLDIAPWDSDAAAIYGPIRRQLELNRQQIGDLDTMIAAHAMSLDATLVTNNIEHFRRVPGLLKLENWLEA